MYQVETSINENEWHGLSEAKLNEAKTGSGQAFGENGKVFKKQFNACSSAPSAGPERPGSQGCLEEATPPRR